MWGWIKRTARKIGRAVDGAFDYLINASSWILHRLLGIPELLLSLLNLRWRKKMRLKVLILRDANNKPLASEAEVQAIVDEAKVTFRQQTNIRIIPASGDAEIVATIASQNPSYVLSPKCDEGTFKHGFTRVGRWFRIHSNRYSSQGGATVFVVGDVQGKAGCFFGPFHDYGYIDDGALRDAAGKPVSAGQKLTLAHELAHACELFHRSNPTNLMAASGQQRTRHLTRWQRAVVRSSARARYF